MADFDNYRRKYCVGSKKILKITITNFRINGRHKIFQFSILSLWQDYEGRLVNFLLKGGRLIMKNYLWKILTFEFYPIFKSWAPACMAGAENLNSYSSGWSHWRQESVKSIFRKPYSWLDFNLSPFLASISFLQLLLNSKFWKNSLLSKNYVLKDHFRGKLKLNSPRRDHPPAWVISDTASGRFLS